ncbi:HdeA/HdeB family chaperone [Methylocystis sp. MJC1]|uniref:HdeA/HdeB family chaperone n=1 Tax=Methylocystis sp. MJC1 TaxID=2654282 RepID=UPI0020A67D97|nr:HdeA/HdeB family chaperone [Methylocystis sp. MJC1]
MFIPAQVICRLKSKFVFCLYVFPALALIGEATLSRTLFDCATEAWRAVHFLEENMNKLIFGIAMAGMLAPAAVQAQVKIDMTKITCGELLALPPEDQADFGAFMSGWFAQKSGRTSIDLVLFQKNAASVTEWCAANKSESVMAGLQRAFDKKQ